MCIRDSPWARYYECINRDNGLKLNSNLFLNLNKTMLDFSELSCTKCRKAFNMADRVPRLLAECGHTICSTCLSSLLLQSPDSQGFECPEDGIVCGSNKRSCEDFPKNLSLLRILEKQQPAPKVENKNVCPAHKKNLEIVCVDCKKRLCSKCALFDGHRAHDLRTEEDVHNELMLRRELLEDMLQMVTDNEQIFSRKDELSVVYEQCIKKKAALDKLIEDQFTIYFNMLAAKKANALQKVNDVMISVKERFKMLSSTPKDLPARVGRWKHEY
eukprot:TRINITY_DN7768_c0_g5_i1.p1 TRINITY_DN7768_c0_g5~~TRINITY_DN7768_c0_g5_i1.p1  ORF type:complete len:272 (+),score=82.50 TRINITY_DN7768_c0_g5_i1:70-885(+)